MDLPMSSMLLSGKDSFSSRMLAAINGAMLDMLAAIARKVDKVAIAIDRPIQVAPAAWTLR